MINPEKSLSLWQTAIFKERNRACEAQEMQPQRSAQTRPSSSRGCVRIGDNVIIGFLLLTEIVMTNGISPGLLLTKTRGCIKLR